MKGICIFLIVLHHSGLMNDAGRLTFMLDNMRLPLYYFVAGLFVSDKRSPVNFAINKINRLIIPFAFFNFLWITIMLSASTAPMQQWIDGKEWLRGLFTAANSPTWFLMALFMSYMVYYAFLKLAKTKTFAGIGEQAVVMVVAAGFGKLLGDWLYLHGNESLIGYVMYHSRIANALGAMPFLWVAGIAVRKDLLVWSPTLWIRLAIMATALVIWALCATGINLYSAYAWETPVIAHYAAAFSGIAFVWLLAQWVQKFPFLSLIGRYSIVVLCTHDIIISLFRQFAIDDPWLTAFTVFLLSPALIEVCVKLLPHLSAQKDLLPERKKTK